jgi:MFS family permease
MRDRLLTGVAAAEDEDEKVFRTRRLSEFVYGVISAMIAIAGLSDNSEPIAGFAAAAAVVAGAAAIWLAHSYADWLGERVRERHELGFQDILHVAATAWPIVIAGVIVSLPIALAETSLWDLETGLLLGNLTGLVILALIGLYAGILAQMSALRTLALMLLTIGLGALVIGVEQAVHHLV